jgi:S-adenosylmethionine:tRNA ribosyltransferase-isomerase
VEALVLNAHESEATEALVMARSSKPLRPGQVVTLGGSDCVVQEALGKGRYRLGLPTGVPSVAAFVEAVGQLPLPPYIKRPSGPSAEDEVRYQTVFAGQGGAVAAPTAGLHFTDSLLDGLRQAGCELQMVTLFVGPGTFTPVRTEDLDAHQMHAESYLIGDATADAIRSAKRSGRPVLAVGTTALRALEGAAAQHGGEVVAGAGTTEIFIRPGYSFQVVDQLLTNFHLPGSTLLMLVSALAGRQRMLQAYGEAVDNGYRFFSYGDGMLIR